MARLFLHFESYAGFDQHRLLLLLSTQISPRHITWNASLLVSFILCNSILKTMWFVRVASACKMFILDKKNNVAAIIKIHAVICPGCLHVAMQTHGADNEYQLPLLSKCREYFKAVRVLHIFLLVKNIKLLLLSVVIITDQCMPILMRKCYCQHTPANLIFFSAEGWGLVSGKSLSIKMETEHMTGAAEKKIVLVK